MISLTNAGLLLTFLLAVGAVWLAVSRFSMKPDSSWPLIFYLALVAYNFSYPNVVNAYVLYVAVVAGLLLRFEFLNERLINFIRVVEVILLCVIGWNMFAVLMKQF